jgi:hypothetical protein
VGHPASKSDGGRFGVFELDASSGELRRNGTLVKRREQPARTLLLLSRRTALTLFGTKLRHFVHASVTPLLISQLCSLTQHRARCCSHSAHLNHVHLTGFWTVAKGFRNFRLTALCFSGRQPVANARGSQFPSLFPLWFSRDS